jgi:SAM-dependent methyltransferase
MVSCDVPALFRRLAIFALLAILLSSAAAIVVSFPWSTDPQGDQSSSGAHSTYYEKAYSPGADSKIAVGPSASSQLSPNEQRYTEFARQAATSERIQERIMEFVEKYGLRDKKVIEIGAGSGLLQDVVADYTALDISPTAQRFFHKPFLAASATDIPVRDNSFDALWSIWVLEHIPNPEKALLEMRRVVKSGSYIFLLPAFEVDRYASQGYSMRPYSDFNWEGKLAKATIPIAESRVYHYLQAYQIRLLRSLGARLGGSPTRFHFIKLTPNYDHYWGADSDATTSFSYHELYLWFKTRGDQCLNCPPEFRVSRRVYGTPLIIQVHKK